MTASQDNQRSHPRYEVYAIARIGEIDHSHVSLVRNLSMGGACIECHTPAEIGHQVEVDITFPELQASLSALAEVVWVNGQTPKEMGLRFVALTTPQKLLLAAYLDKAYANQADL